MTRNFIISTIVARVKVGIKDSMVFVLLEPMDLVSVLPELLVQAILPEPLVLEKFVLPEPLVLAILPGPLVLVFVLPEPLVLAILPEPLGLAKSILPEPLDLVFVLPELLARA